jgi:hypothetical protein
MIVIAFKPKIDLKAFTPFKDESRWIQWWNHFKITLGGQGMEAVLDTAYIPREPDKALGFVRMQNMVYTILSEKTQTPAANVVNAHYGVVI